MVKDARGDLHRSITIRFPQKLAEVITAEGIKQEREFSAQVRFLCMQQLKAQGVMEEF